MEDNKNHKRQSLELEAQQFPQLFRVGTRRLMHLDPLKISPYDK